MKIISLKNPLQIGLCNKAVLTAKDSHFYKQGLPQGMKKTYAIDYSVLEGGHMFPLEQPKQTAEFVQQLIKEQQGNK